jgi:hypothetical protein
MAINIIKEIFNYGSGTVRRHFEGQYHDTFGNFDHAHKLGAQLATGAVTDPKEHVLYLTFSTFDETYLYETPPQAESERIISSKKRVSEYVKSATHAFFQIPEDNSVELPNDTAKIEQFVDQVFSVTDQFPQNGWGQLAQGLVIGELLKQHSSFGSEIGFGGLETPDDYVYLNIWKNIIKIEDLKKQEFLVRTLGSFYHNVQFDLLRFSPALEGIRTGKSMFECEHDPQFNNKQSNFIQWNHQGLKPAK